MPPAARARVHDGPARHAPVHLDRPGVTGSGEAGGHELDRLVGKQREGFRRNDELHDVSRYRPRDLYRPLAGEEPDHGDQHPAILQQSHPRGQLVLECHDTISCATAFIARQRVPPDLMGFSVHALWLLRGGTNVGRTTDARRDVDSPRAAVIGARLRARRWDSLNVNGIPPNLLLPTRQKKPRATNIDPKVDPLAARRARRLARRSPVALRRRL